MCIEDGSIQDIEPNERIKKTKRRKRMEQTQKYITQRFNLLHRFTDQIRFDEESWYSITPELIATHIAARISNKSTIIDGFCGCGGNTIQFARIASKVIAIDIDIQRLRIASTLAKLYNVAQKIQFVHGNFFTLCSSLKADVVFLSPPWGGTNYRENQYFDLENHALFNIVSMYRHARTITDNIILFLPKNCRHNDLALLPHLPPCTCDGICIYPVDIAAKSSVISNPIGISSSNDPQGSSSDDPQKSLSDNLQNTSSETPNLHTISQLEASAEHPLEDFQIDSLGNTLDQLEVSPSSFLPSQLPSSPTISQSSPSLPLSSSPLPPPPPMTSSLSSLPSPPSPLPPPPPPPQTQSLNDLENHFIFCHLYSTKSKSSINTVETKISNTIPGIAQLPYCAYYDSTLPCDSQGAFPNTRWGEFTLDAFLLKTSQGTKLFNA